MCLLTPPPPPLPTPSGSRELADMWRPCINRFSPHLNNICISVFFYKFLNIRSMINKSSSGMQLIEKKWGLIGAKIRVTAVLWIWVRIRMDPLDFGRLDPNTRYGSGRAKKTHQKGNREEISWLSALYYILLLHHYYFAWWWRRIRIRETQKHADPDPQHWLQTLSRILVINRNRTLH